MIHESWKKPTHITCSDCPTVVRVKKHGPVPTRCDSCAKKHAAKQSRAWKKEHPYGPRVKPDEERDLGPERPLLGLTEVELLAWREKRAVQLYRSEPELRLCDLAERLGVSVKQVGAYLAKAGLSIRKDGRGLLPAGPPA